MIRKTQVLLFALLCLAAGWLLWPAVIHADSPHGGGARQLQEDDSSAAPDSQGEEASDDQQAGDEQGDAAADEAPSAPPETPAPPAPPVPAGPQVQPLPPAPPAPPEQKEDQTIYKVVLNHEEQYSIWPANRENALGWKDAGFSGTKEQCLAHIKEVWTDMRPLSLRKKMEEMNKPNRSARPASTARPDYVICLQDEAPVFDFVWENGKLKSATCPFDGNTDISKFAVPQQK